MAIKPVIRRERATFIGDQRGLHEREVTMTIHKVVIVVEVIPYRHKIKTKKDNHKKQSLVLGRVQ